MGKAKSCTVKSQVVTSWEKKREICVCQNEYILGKKIKYVFQNIVQFRTINFFLVSMVSGLTLVSFSREKKWPCCLPWCHRPRRVFRVVEGKTSPFPAILLLWDTFREGKCSDRDTHCYWEPAAKCCRPLGKVLKKTEAFLRKNYVFSEILQLQNLRFLG